MKKGFTLIEIIISIGLILVIGTISSIYIINKKNNIESITKEILEAGKLYLKIELDKNGNNYDKEIYKGAKGVKISLSNLVSKGYIDESLKQSVIDYAGTLDNDKDYYVMFIENNEYCDENQIVGLSSWMEKGKDIYLCEDYENISEETNLIDTILNDHGTIDTLELNSDDINLIQITVYSSNGDSLFYTKQNGLFKRNNSIYYYRGNVLDNYLNINGNTYRILSFDTSSSTIKIIMENAIRVYSYSTLELFKKNNLSDYYYEYLMGISNIIEDNAPYYTETYTLKSTGTNYYIIDLSSGENTTDYNQTGNYKLGLITLEEAYYTGIPLIEITTNSYYSSLILTSNSWLSEGDSTLISNTYKKGGTSKYQLNLINEKPSNNGILKKGVLSSFKESEYAYKDDIKIRPVLTIKNINVKGNGTHTNPYVMVY